MTNFNRSGSMTRKPFSPASYIAWHDQQKVQALKQRMEENQISQVPANANRQSAGARKRGSSEAQLPYDPYQQDRMAAIQQLRNYQRQSRSHQQPSPRPSSSSSSSVSSFGDPVIEDTKKYLEMKRKKQAFEDFLLVKRLQKEKEKSARKVAKLEKDFEKHQETQSQKAQNFSQNNVESSKKE